MPTPDEFVRALRNERAYAGDHPILGRSPVTAPPVFGPAETWRALGSPDPLNLARTYHSSHPMEAAQNTLEGLFNLMGPIPAKAAGAAGVAAFPALVRYGAQATEHIPAPFYSAAERAIGEAGLSKAPLSQWLATLRNKGVKEEELNWLGIGKSPLGDVPNWQGHVTKDQLNDWVKGHGVQLNEVNRGITPEQIDEFAHERGIGDTGLAEQMWKEEYGDHPTKFQQYQLPGGSNYRETLLTLLQQTSPQDLLAKGYRTETKEYKGIPEVHVFDPQGNRVHIQPGLDNFGRRSNPTEESALTQYVNSSKNPVQFTGSHWDEPNVLAHVRSNDRTLPPAEPGGDPRKALFMEELQSDWHQRGRKSGYQYPAGEKPTFTLEGNGPWVVRDQRGNMVRDYNNRDLAEKHVQMANAGDMPSDYSSHLAAQQDKPPDAPFKQSWPDLALKRMLAKAAHEGYDALAWTPGDVQAARYDLSKHVDNVSYIPSTKELIATKNGDAVIHQRSVEPEKLADYIGKDAAEKLLGAEDTVNPRYKDQPFKNITGVDLKVGGEGMRAFYDKMLVDKANALGKRYGAKVEQAPLHTDEVETPKQHPFTQDELKEFEKIGFYSSNPMIYPRMSEPNMGELGQIKNQETHDKLWDYIYGHRERDLGGEGRNLTQVDWDEGYNPNWKETKANVHVLPITPELRAAAQKGFPLFATGGVAALGAAQPGEQQEQPKAPDENARMLNALRGQPGEL